MDATTDGEKPGGSPRNLRVDPVSSNEFKVTWDPPDHDLWNGEILGYHVGYKEFRYELRSPVSSKGIIFWNCLLFFS